MCSRVICLELLNYFLIKLLTNVRALISIYSIIREKVRNICFSFSSEKINPGENFVETDIWCSVGFNRKKYTQKILSEKTRIICKLTSFSPWKRGHRRCSIKKIALKTFQNLHERLLTHFHF